MPLLFNKLGNGHEARLLQRQNQVNSWIPAWLSLPFTRATNKTTYNVFIKTEISMSVYTSANIRSFRDSAFMRTFPITYFSDLAFYFGLMCVILERNTVSIAMQSTWKETFLLSQWVRSTVPRVSNSIFEEPWIVIITFFFFDSWVSMWPNKAVLK